jgi:superfamily II DNA or RNA helicase
MVDLPTGAGKTRVAIEAIINWAKVGGSFPNVLWIAEREELCEQAVGQWVQLWRWKGLLSERLHVQRYWGGRAGGTTGRPEGSNWVVVPAGRHQL